MKSLYVEKRCKLILATRRLETTGCDAIECKPIANAIKLDKGI